METTDAGRPTGRGSARRGLLLLLGGLGVGLAFSLIYAGLLEWWFREIAAGRSDGGQMALVQSVGRIGTAASLLVALAVAAGCALLARASRLRVWAYVAMALAVVGAGLTLVQLGLQAGDDPLEVATLRVLTAIAAAISVLEWLAIGLAVREAMRAARLSVSGGAAATWLAATGVDLILGLGRIEALWGLVGWEQARLLLHGLSSSAAAARLILLAGARRALADSPGGGALEAGDAAAPLAGEEPSSPAAAGALGLYRAGLIAHVAIAALGAVLAVLTGVTGASPGALLDVVAVPQLIAAGLLVVGLFRLGALAPAATARVAALCVLVAVAIQAYAASIVWRLTAVAERAASGSWGGMSVGDVLDLSRRLPALEMAGTVVSLVGFLAVAAALQATAGWLGHPRLGARAVALSVGVSFVALGAGCLRLYLATARRPDLGVVTPMVIVAIAVGLVLFVSYLGVLGRFIERLRGPGVAVPAARLVKEGRDPAPPAG